MSHPGARVLAEAARAYAAVLAGHSATEVLGDRQARAGASPAVRAITLGTLRWSLRLEPLLEDLLASRRSSRVEEPLRALLVVALHQLEYSRSPAPWTVNAAADAARLLRRSSAAGLVNAVLRRFLRERDALLAANDVDPARASAHPAWLLAALQSAWPAELDSLLRANNEHPPMVLRVDLSRTSREAMLTQLARQGLTVRAPEWSATALELERPIGVQALQALPGFAAGLLSVQDAGAQLAAALLQVRPHERVLDACAAPGGKTGALLEAAGGALDLTAVDSDPDRVRRIEENLGRIGRHAHVVCADLRADADWRNGKRFDAILLDAPCSGTGVIRRHPDIKRLRRAEDVPAFAALQRELLGHCLGWLRPGGRLLYCTCSVLPEENEQVLAAVLSEASGAAVWRPKVPLPPEARCLEHGLQLLPGSAARTDGFYYACLTVT